MESQTANFDDALRSFEKLAEQPQSAADYETLQALFSTFPEKSFRANADSRELTRLYRAVSPYVNFTTANAKEMVPGYTTDDYIQACVTGLIEKTLMRPSFPSDLMEDALEESLRHYLSWLISDAPDHHLDRFFYEAFCAGAPVVCSLLERLGKKCEASSRCERGWIDGIKSAIQMDRHWEDLRSQHWNSFRQDGAPTFCELAPLLEHPHFMVRAAAAKAVGAGLEGWEETASYVPPFPELLALIEKNELVYGNVAGGFVNGVNGGSCEGLFFVRDVAAEKGIDIRAWALRVCKAAQQWPRDAPNVTPWWFYIHEFFSFDSDAVKSLIGMGNSRLALMTATEDAPACMMPIIESLTKDSDSSIAAQARYFLRIHDKRTQS